MPDDTENTRSDAKLSRLPSFKWMTRDVSDLIPMSPEQAKEMLAKYKTAYPAVCDFFSKAS